MSKYKSAPSKETINDAEKIAKATQRPGQTKEQTKLVAQGIQKGIEQFKKQQKSKSRELDKKLKSLNKNPSHQKDVIQNEEKNQPSNSFNWLPWGLLFVSWVFFSIYIILFI